MNATTLNTLSASAAVLPQVLALSHTTDPPPSEATLLFHLVSHIDDDISSRLVAASAGGPGPHQSYIDSHMPLLFRAIELDYPDLTTTLLRIHPPWPRVLDWDTLSAAAVGSQSPKALRAILSHPSFAFRSGSVLWTAWGNGDREACEMVLQVGQVRDCQLAYVIAYEEEGVGMEPIFGLGEARRALARAKAVGQRPLPMEKEAVAVEVKGVVGRPSLMDLPDDVLEYWVYGGFVGQLELARLRQTCWSLNTRLPTQPSHLTGDLFWRLLAHLMSAGPIAPQVTSLVARDLTHPRGRNGDESLVLLQALLTLRSTKPTFDAFSHVRASFTVVVAMDVLLLSIDDHFIQAGPQIPLESSPAFNTCFARAFAAIPDLLIPDLIHVPHFIHAMYSLDPTRPTQPITTLKQLAALLIQGRHSDAIKLIHQHAPDLAAAKLDLIHTLAVALRLGSTSPRGACVVVDALLNDVGAWSPVVRMDCIEVSRVLVHAVAAGSVERVRQVVAWFPEQFEVASEMPRESWRRCEAAAEKYADRGAGECFHVLKGL